MKFFFENSTHSAHFSEVWQEGHSCVTGKGHCRLPEIFPLVGSGKGPLTGLAAVRGVSCPNFRFVGVWRGVFNPAFAPLPLPKQQAAGCE